jgi:hypothetical protein
MEPKVNGFKTRMLSEMRAGDQEDGRGARAGVNRSKCQRAEAK